MISKVWVGNCTLRLGCLLVVVNKSDYDTLEIWVTYPVMDSQGRAAGNLP